MDDYRCWDCYFWLHVLWMVQLWRMLPLIQMLQRYHNLLLRHWYLRAVVIHKYWRMVYDVLSHITCIQLEGWLVTHWPLGDVAVISKVWFSNSLCRIVASTLTVKLLSSECHRTSLIRVNIGSGNGLVPSGNKPLSEAMVTHVYVAICGISKPQWVNIGNHTSTFAVCILALDW